MTTEPHDIDAEAALLGSLLLDYKTTAEAISMGVTPEAFHLATHGTIYRVLREMFIEGVSSDIVLLRGRLDALGVLDLCGGEQYIVELADAVPSAASAPHYAKLVMDKYHRRKLIKVVKQAQESLQSSASNDDCVGQITKGLLDLTREGADTFSIGELLAYKHDAILEMMQTGEIPTIPTGFRDIDDMIGGFEAGNFVVIGARPSMGKSALAAHIGLNMADFGKPTVFYSIEMTKRGMATRLLSTMAMIDSRRLRQAVELTDPDMNVIKRAMVACENLGYYFVFMPGATADQIISHAKLMKESKGVEAVIVDFLQLLQTNRSSDAMTYKIAENCKALNSMAKSEDLVVMALSQLNRGPVNREDKHPQLADMEGSGSIEQIADIIMLLHREDYYHKHKSDYNKTNLCDVDISKNRDGATGLVSLKFRGDVARFYDKESYE